MRISSERGLGWGIPSTRISPLACHRRALILHLRGVAIPSSVHRRTAHGSERPKFVDTLEIGIPRGSLKVVSEVDGVDEFLGMTDRSIPLVFQAIELESQVSKPILVSGKLGDISLTKALFVW